MVSLALGRLRVGSVVARAIPLWLARPTATLIGTHVISRLSPAKLGQLERNLARVVPDADGRRLRSLARQGFGSYARYWVESLKIPYLNPSNLGDQFTVEGYEHIVTALGSGGSAILALPHVGGWEWGGAWLSRCKQFDVVAVAEKLEPADVFDWFVDLRSSYGVDVIGLEPGAFGKLQARAADNTVICLLCDRDINGEGVEVEFFGESTTVPAGPAVLALRTGAPILPAAVYFEKSGVRAVVLDPIDVTRQEGEKLSIAAKRVSADVTAALEQLIKAAPSQWHMLSANWPSDGPSSIK